MYLPWMCARMVAKQGDSQVWHFAHHRAESCEAGYESALHMAVKQILAEERCLLLPHCGVIRHPIPINGHPLQERSRRLSREDRDRGVTWFDVFEYATTSAGELGQSHFKIPEWGFADLPARTVHLDVVLIEKADGDIRPDIIGVVGGRRIFIEVAVTHFIDKEKLARIRDRGVATLEIVIPPTASLDWAALRSIILSDPAGKYWRFNPRAERLAQASYEARVDAANASASKKKSIYEAKYKPTHEVIFRGRPGVVMLSLTPSFITLKTTSTKFNDYLAQAFKKRQYSYFNERLSRWEIIPTVSVFFEIASELKALPYLDVEDIRAPTALERSQLWNHLGFPEMAEAILAANQPPTA
ncbi:hypothetical protein AU476_19215 [Cupriavidus sp. UYMSc13B]|nr:hypothetical protein AU476_19215 [Cupriavidus sp. UYMSc13B]